MIWRVSEFIPRKHFGFCEALGSPETKAFFHSRNFIRVHPGEVGPVLGEQIRVGQTLMGPAGSFAPAVERISPPVLSAGFVVSYSPEKEWGFLSYLGGEIYFHRREITGHQIPLPGTPVDFVCGIYKGKPRACWVNIRRNLVG